MSSLLITAIQADIHWENVPANLAMYDQHLSNISASTDIVILPEMCTTGFTMNPAKVAETMDGQTVQWLTAKAKALDCVITGSFVIEENGKYYNRMIWMQPDGVYHTYDKRHLFRMAEEDKVYTGGDKRVIVSYKGWNFCLQICYDLRFPVWSRNRNNEYDCLIYVANWPDIRTYPWARLLVARAIENQAYVVGVNRVGKDPNGVQHSGHSVVVDGKGKVIETQSERSAVFSCKLSKKKLDKFRQKFPVWMDADGFEILQG